MKYYIIASSQRSGSHFLKDLLIQQKCGRAFDYLERINTISDLYETGHLGGVWGMTLFAVHLDKKLEILKKLAEPVQYNNFHMLNQLFPGVKFVHLFRQNKIKQAISRVKALRTGRYTSSDDEVDCGMYSENEIAKSISYACRNDAKWLNFFSAGNIKPYTLTYEELCDNTRDALMGLFDFLQVKREIEINLESLPKRLYDSTSEDWYSKFMRRL